MWFSTEFQEDKKIMVKKGQRAKFKKAFKYCIKKYKPFTKAFGVCMKKQLKK
jgi:Cft2 family RNA processing exonuclease